LSIAFDKKREKKFGMRLKTVVTLHRQKEQKEFLRQQEKEIKHLNIYIKKLKKGNKLWQRLQFQ
jgi:hypothetical protein